MEIYRFTTFRNTQNSNSNLKGWSFQYKLRLDLNELMDIDITTLFGNSFQSLMTLWEKLCIRIGVFALGLMNFLLLPRVIPKY